MQIFRFILTRKTFISMVFIGLTMLGYLSYRQLPVELMPNAELPYLIVTVSSSRDMNPEYIEKQAVIPLEGGIGTLNGIDTIETTVGRNRGTIYLYYNQGVEIRYAYLKLIEKVNTLRSSIPDEFRVNVVKVDTERLTNIFMRLQVRGSGGEERIRAVVDEQIADELLKIDGVANVEVVGGDVKAMEIVLDPDACHEYNITPSQVRSLISQNNQVKLYLGQAYENNRRYSINLVADYTDVNDLEDIIVSPNGPILLKDIAKVNFGEKEQTSISRVNGKEAISIQLVRDSQVNLIDLSHRTLETITRLNEKLKPLDIEIVVQSNSAEDIEKNINLIIELAIIGSLLAVYILWVFLRNIKLVAVITLAIPISVFTAFNLFYAWGISINSLTLVGMALAVGMLLDCSVVVIENIYRLASTHRDPETAVIQGTLEVWRPLFAATLTTITVFLPFLFSSNFLIRLIGRHVGVSIVSTLIISFVVALTLVPMLSHFFLSGSGTGKGVHFNRISQKNRLLQIYNLLLKSTIRFPARTIIAAVVTFFVSLLLCMALSLEVPQEIETNSFDLYVTMPRGSSLERTDTVVRELEEKLADIKEIKDVICTVYEEESNVTVILKEDFESIDKRTIPQIKQDIQSRIETIAVASVSLSAPQSSTRYGGGMSRNPAASLQRMFGIGTPQEKIVVKGGDFVMLRTVAEDIKYYIDNLDTISGSSRLSVQGDRPEIHLYFDNSILNLFSISMNSIAAELSSFESEFSSGLTFKQGVDEYDIVIRTRDSDEEKTFEDLKELPIHDENGGTHELQNVSTIVYSHGSSQFNRVNQEKQVEVTFSFETDITNSKALLDVAREEVDQLVASMSVPAGIAVEVVHDENELSEFYILIAAAFILIFMILASVFESLATPVVMMFTIPLAAVGAFWALVLTGNSIFNANSLIGLLILLGVVVNNGIILIDYTRVLRNRGHSRPRALIAAGQARVRPILITAITTIVAMSPLAMGNTEQISRIGAPFAITVIGGLALSTLFTLIFLPTVYSGLESSLAWIRSLPWKIKILQLTALIIGTLLIYFNVESLIWRGVHFFVLIMAVPGCTYFVMTSLRRARTDYIKPGEPLVITVRRVVKIYDYYTRFVREWNKGERMKKLYGSAKEFSSWSDYADLLFWRLPLLGFLIFFIYVYLKNTFWIFFLSHIVYFNIFSLLPFVRVLLTKITRGKSERFNGVLASIVLWTVPAVNLFVFYLKDFETPILVFIALLWLILLIVYTTSNRLHRGRINIMRLTGRFADVRRRFYQLVLMIPIIGKRKKPFNALDGVSLDIRSGMFGLLGPNGAGKTTIMRIICGILNQTLGTVKFNSFDFRSQREELQGLIGYLPQEFGTYENMTAYEFLDYIAILKNILDKKTRDETVRRVLAGVHLDENIHQKIGSYSGGMKQRIGIAMTLLHMPRILVVDEPTAGLDPRERIRFRNILVELSSERIVIFSTHIIEDISSSCNKVAVLNRGKLSYLGNPGEMTRLAEGKVWQFTMTPPEYESIRHKLRIVHHMNIDGNIRVRCLSATTPREGAETVRPTLEDSYLWLLGK